MAKEEHDDADFDQASNVQEVYLSSGSSYKSSSLSGTSPSSSQERQPRSEKRKNRGQDLDEPQSRSKRLRASYNDHYRKLFNESVNDIAHRGLLTRAGQLDNSQIGIAHWSAEEKESVFNSIEAWGQHNLPAIAEAVGTKTELEIYDFIRLLKGGSANRHLHGTRKALLDASTIPAAFEISDECDAALEEAADALSVLQRREDVKAERRSHGNDGLLTPKLAKMIDRCLNRSPNGEAEVTKSVPSAVLLDLKAFLHLSSQLFMNSGDPEYNWRSFAEGRERPSMLFGAFSDLASLVVAVTERLVQSVLFFAMSRLRAMDASTYNASRHVTPDDVKVALETLGMKANAHDYWVGLARRGKLDVVDARGRSGKHKATGVKLNYDRIEAILGHGRNEKGQYSRSKSAVRSRGISRASHPSETASSPPSSADENARPESSPGDEIPSSPALSDSTLTPASSKSIRVQNRFDYDQLQYMSALDQRNSLEEEQRLWALLAKVPSIQVDSAGVELPLNPGPERKARDDLIDWRDEDRYCPDWELNTTSVPREHFARNRATWRRRKRKIAKWEDVETVEETEDSTGSDVDNRDPNLSRSSTLETRSLNEGQLSDDASSIASSGISSHSESDEESLNGGEIQGRAPSPATSRFQYRREDMDIDEPSSLIQPGSPSVRSSVSSSEGNEKHG